MSDKKPRRLLSADHSEIKLVPKGARDVWEPAPPKRSERQRKAQRKEIAECIAQRRAERNSE